MALGEYAGPGRSDRRHVADRVNVGERGLERLGIDRDPPIDCHSRLDDDRWGTVNRDREKQVVAHLTAVAERCHVAGRIERAHLAARVP